MATTHDEAFFVRYDRPTMTQDHFAGPEFVILRILQQTWAESQTRSMDPVRVLSSAVRFAITSVMRCEPL